MHIDIKNHKKAGLKMPSFFLDLTAGVFFTFLRPVNQKHTLISFTCACMMLSTGSSITLGFQSKSTNFIPSKYYFQHGLL